MNAEPATSVRLRAIGKVVLFWSGMLIAAEMLLSQPPIRGRGIVWQQMGRVVLLPGEGMAHLLGQRFAGPSTDWHYWPIAFIASFAFWGTLTTYIYYRRNWKWDGQNASRS